MLYARGSCLLRCIPRCPMIQRGGWSPHVLMAQTEGSSPMPRWASTTGKKKGTPPKATAEQGEQFPQEPDVPGQQGEQPPLDHEAQPTAPKGRRRKMTLSGHLDNGTGQGTGPQLSFQSRLPGKESVKILHVGPRVKASEYVAAILPRVELQDECRNLKELEKYLRQVIRLAEEVPIYPMKWDTGPESDLPKVVFTEETYDKGLAEARCILLREVREGRPHDPDVPGPGEVVNSAAQRRASTAKKGPTRRRKADTAGS